MDALATLLVYLALAATAAGAVSVIYPLRWIAIRSRKAALLVLGGGVAGFWLLTYLPVPEMRVYVVRTHLDQFVPAYQFGEFHSVYVNASKERVYEAIHEVRPREIRLFHALMSIRGLHGPAEDRPILASFTSGGFLPLGDDASEIVFGRAAHPGRVLRADQFADDQEAPLLRIAMNFRILEADAAHCLLTTETRVDALGGDMRRGFATYWRLIHPGSAIIRRMWLRAIKERAERGAPPEHT